MPCLTAPGIEPEHPVEEQTGPAAEVSNVDLGTRVAGVEKDRREFCEVGVLDVLEVVVDVLISAEHRIGSPETAG